MITKFGSTFGGHVDFDDIGLDGTAVNDRWLSDERLATVFDKTEAIARLMDRTGYDTFWLTEHHFQREGFGCIPNIILLGLHLASVTQRLRFGCAFNTAPIWHPLRLAEDFATADILRGGRLILGVGRGYHTREVEVFGAPMLDQDANRDLFEEKVDIIFKAFNEPSFSYHGKYYDIPPRVPYRGYELKEITLVPRPLRRPVECWQPIVSASPRGIEFMVKHGIKGVIDGGAAVGGANDKVVAAWRAALVKAGREAELGTDLLISFSVFSAETQDKAIREAKKFFEESIKMFAPLGFVRGVTDEQIEAIADPRRARQTKLPTLEEAVEAGSWLCGPPELVIEKLMEVQGRYHGLDQVSVGQPVGTPQSVVLEQLDLFATEVMPAFKSNVPAPATAG